ncbi:MAG: hypothetical protein E6J13_03990 [Chloroflexi bacterium]|nr:MAG: hypothetical protein E6J13_03990 [Chloroflexota bacterium]
MRRDRLNRIGAVLVAVALALGPSMPFARAESALTEKIDPALQALMQARPLSLLPVIVEMQPPVAPFATAANVGRANEALELLRLNGTAAAGLPLINAAAGFASAVGIDAISLAPNVAYIHHDATVSLAIDPPPTLPPVPTVTPLPTLPPVTATPVPTPSPAPTPTPTPAPASPLPTPTAAPSPTDTPTPAPIASPGATSTQSPAPSPSDSSVAAYPKEVNADQVWSQGSTGRGVTVAVLDSGVAADPDLVQPTSRLLASVNFADERSVSDPGGHGTHVAGIIAGNGTRSEGAFVGIAPQANIVDVRVLGRTGSGRISSVVRGIEWVLAHRATYNIRVMNLSFGAPAQTSYRTDPMSAAVEIAWRNGLVVVVASGNSGPGGNTVASPGIDPYAITVGATDDHGTTSPRDDTLATFSSWGTASATTYAKPDLVAPGRRIVSIRVPGSALDTLYPDRVVTAPNGSTYMRLSGTSMATPVVSGAVALLLQGRPSLTPDQVKGLLIGTTQPYGQDSGVAPPDPAADGSGLLDAFAATQAQTDTSAGTGGTTVPTISPSAVNRGLRPADAFARAILPVLWRLPLRWKIPTVTAIAAEPSTWDSVAWDSVAWDNYDWDSVAWDSVAWDSVAWDSVAWDSVAWDSVAWDSVAWDSIAWDAFGYD